MKIKNKKITNMGERLRTWVNVHELGRTFTNVGTFTKVHEPSRTSFMKDVMNAHDCKYAKFRKIARNFG